MKVWVEVPAEVDQVSWRGHITHVPSGDKKYIKDLDGITLFIGKYLRQMGVQVKLRRQLADQLKRLLRNTRRIWALKDE